METIFFRDEKVHLIDQTKLPSNEEYLVTDSFDDICDAISILKVRGAPAIGVAAAYGIYLGAKEIIACEDFESELKNKAETIKATRPTAVNLAWAVDRVLEKVQNADKENVLSIMKEEADKILHEDIAMNTRMGEFGKGLIPENARVLTHCNAGALATGGYGTALGVIRSAHKDGKIKMVYADETRPLLQGARLTAYELMRDEIPVTLITDNMAAFHMAQGLVDCIVVGADRIASNGDTANKIGTYNLAVLAKYHNIPMYIAAPYSTFDLSLKSGKEIPIEERNHEEVRSLQGVVTAPKEVLVSNPAFDVTPNELITAIITDKGIIEPNYIENIPKVLKNEK